jgi:hypothetical protein
MARVTLVLGLLALAGPARGEPAPLVNLITDAPTSVAVSSTVANRAILPAHLIDGDLGTAWNSRTGDLQGAWIGARVPADARVAKIRMTVGFTKVDPKLGDLFTMNPRIRKVRVLRDGATVIEQTLDPALRTLQDIPIDQPGGEYKIVVVDIVPGTRSSWREISVSELEIWGSLPAGVAATSNTPVVRVGAFDPVSKADCVTAMFPRAKADRLPSGELLTKTGVVAVSSDLAVCRIERTRKRHEQVEIDIDHHADATYADTTVELAPVTRTPHLAAGEHLEAATPSELVDMTFPPDSPGVGSAPSQTTTVGLSAFPLTTGESAVLVEVTSAFADPGIRNEKTVSTLYRVTAARLAPILSYESTYGRDENRDETGQRCQLVTPKPAKSLPETLALSCSQVDQPHDGKATSAASVEKYRWRGDHYER